MATLPDQQRAYFTRGNIPFNGKTTSQLEMESYYAWVLARCLMDTEVSGSAYGTRHPSTAWFCRGSGNEVSSSLATAKGVQGVFIWPTMFTGSLVRGTSSTRHHWALFENTASGYELLIDLASSVGNLAVTIGVTGSFGGANSTAQIPTASLAANVVGLANTGWDASNSGQFAMFGGMTTFGETRYAHFTCPSSGSGEYHFCMTTAGAGMMYNWHAVWRTSGSQVGDNRFNMFTLCGNTTVSGRGNPNNAVMITSAFVGSRLPSGAAKSAGGLIIPFVGGTSYIGLQSVDAIDSKYNVEKLDIGDFTPQYVKRGTLTDLYIVGTAPVGASIPNTSQQERIVCGDMIVPWTGSVPLL